MSTLTVSEVRSAIEAAISVQDIKVEDISGGCGSSFQVYIISEEFEGKRLLQRHQLVNAALSDLMPKIHALSIKKAKTPAEVKGEEA